MDKAYLALVFLFKLGVAIGAVPDEHETCDGKACASISSWAKSEDGLQGLEMLQMIAVKTKAGSDKEQNEKVVQEEGEVAVEDPHEENAEKAEEHTEEKVEEQNEEEDENNEVDVEEEEEEEQEEEKEAAEKQNDVAIEQESTQDVKHELSKPKCRWCKHSSYVSKEVSFTCKYPGSDGFKVTVKSESYVKSYGTWNAWVSPHSLSKLYCRPYGRRGASALKSKISGYYTERFPDAVTKKTKYKDRNIRRWNICNCAPCGNCGPNKDLFLKITLKSGRLICDNERIKNQQCDEEVEATTASKAPGGKKTETSSSECVGGWQKADGIGKSEKKIGKASSRDDCIKMVKQKCPDANGLTMNAKSKVCYCEFGQYKTTSSSKYENCALPSQDSCVGGWKKADGIGRSEKKIGKASSRDDCIKMVKQKCPDANGLTINPSTKDCYCEFAQYKTTSSSKYENCALPSKDACIGGWQKGDGNGKTEQHIGKASGDTDCMNKVKKQCPTANGATMSTSSRACYCEFGQTTPSSSNKYVNCALR